MINNVTICGMGLQNPFTCNNLGANATLRNVLDVSGAAYKGLVISVNGAVTNNLDSPIGNNAVVTGSASTKGAC